MPGRNRFNLRSVSKGGRGKVNEAKAKAVATAAEHGISKGTVARAIAKAEGKEPKPKVDMDEVARECKRALKKLDDSIEDQFTLLKTAYETVDPETQKRFRQWLLNAYQGSRDA